MKRESARRIFYSGHYSRLFMTLNSSIFKKKRIPVYVSFGSEETYTDFKKIVLGRPSLEDIDEMERIELDRHMKGKNFHEMGHILFTEPNQMKKIRERYKKLNNQYSVYSEIAANILNIVEDHRIEVLMALMFPGTKKDIKSLNLWILKKQPSYVDLKKEIGTSMNEDDFNFQVFMQNILLYSKLGVFTKGYDPKDYKHHELFLKILSHVNDAKWAKSTISARESVEKIMHIIMGSDLKVPESIISMSNKIEGTSKPLIIEVDKETFEKMNKMKNNEEENEPSDIIIVCRDQEENQVEDQGEGESEIESESEGEGEGEGENIQISKEGTSSKKRSNSERIEDLLSEFEEIKKLSKEDEKTMDSLFRAEKSEEMRELNFDKHSLTNKEMDDLCRSYPIYREDSSSFFKHEGEGKKLKTFSSEKLKKEIKEIFKNKEGFTLNDQRSGRVDKRKLKRVAMSDGRIFIKKGEPVDSDFAVKIAIDGSGSMNGQKMVTAISVAAILEEAMKEFVPLKISIFNTGVRGAAVDNVLKHFDDKDKNNFTLSNFRRHFVTGANRDDVSIMLSALELEKRPERSKILFVINDGLPSMGYNSNEDGIQRTKRAIDNARKKGVIVIGIFISTHRNHERGNESGYKRMFSNKGVIISEIHSLEQNMGREIKKILKESY